MRHFVLVLVLLLTACSTPQVPTPSASPSAAPSASPSVAADPNEVVPAPTVDPSIFPGNIFDETAVPGEPLGQELAVRTVLPITGTATFQGQQLTITEVANPCQAAEGTEPITDGVTLVCANIEWYSEDITTEVLPSILRLVLDDDTEAPQTQIYGPTPQFPQRFLTPEETAAGWISYAVPEGRTPKEFALDWATDDGLFPFRWQFDQ